MRINERVNYDIPEPQAPNLILGYTLVYLTSIIGIGIDIYALFNFK